MKSKKNQQANDLVKSIGELAKIRNQLARQAEQQYTFEVEALLKAQSRDPQRIEHLLDGMLDFCFDSAMLCLYKKLCRYYFKIDPEATASYVYAYRDMWDEKEEG
ncbi:MAG: hypothetical protein HY879_05800 [Deltaproteobacteria bacterium]|nr:hypothetical protein [Deltaproteobacteria bacterium]